MYLNVMEKATSSRDMVKGDVNFYFCSIKGSIGFDYWEDFLIIIDVINNYVFPEEIKYSGITDIFGYFIKMD